MVTKYRVKLVMRVTMVIQREDEKAKKVRDGNDI
jgi:hypothetical protein